MSDNEQNKLDMYEAVLTLLADNREIITGIPQLQSAINKLRKTIDEIRREDKAISAETFEMTIQTSKLKENLIFSLVPVTCALFSFARETGNIQLKEKTRMTQSHFVRLLDKDLLDKAEVIRLLAKIHLHKLKKYGITGEVLNDLRAKANEFRNSLDNKVASFISSSNLTPIKELFHDADKIMAKHMDIGVETVSSTYPEFYDEYLWTRDIENQDEIKVLMEIEDEE
ncbi:MAG: hypothetical protein ACM3S2_15020 [Ignavibacteriales bacterium]